MYRTRVLHQIRQKVNANAWFNRLRCEKNILMYGQMCLAYEFSPANISHFSKIILKNMFLVSTEIMHLVGLMPNNSRTIDGARFNFCNWTLFSLQHSLNAWPFFTSCNQYLALQNRHVIKNSCLFRFRNFWLSTFLCYFDRIVF